MFHQMNAYFPHFSENLLHLEETFVEMAATEIFILNEIK